MDARPLEGLAPQRLCAVRTGALAPAQGLGPGRGPERALGLPAGPPAARRALDAYSTGPTGSNALAGLRFYQLAPAGAIPSGAAGFGPGVATKNQQISQYFQALEPVMFSDLVGKEQIPTAIQSSRTARISGRLKRILLQLRCGPNSFPIVVGVPPPLRCRIGSLR
jgi:hypothetical protein